MSAELQARLAALRTAFIARCKEDASALRAAMVAQDINAAKAIAHRLSGSGTLFGFPEVTKAAARVEALIDMGEAPWTAAETLLAATEAASAQG